MGLLKIIGMIICIPLILVLCILGGMYWCCRHLLNRAVKSLHGDLEEKRVALHLEDAEKANDAKPGLSVDDAKPRLLVDDAKPGLLVDDAKPGLLVDDVKL